MKHEWQQYDHHSEKMCKLTDSEQAELIKAYDAFYSRLDTFDEVIEEAQGDCNERKQLYKTGRC